MATVVAEKESGRKSAIEAHAKDLFAKSGDPGSPTPIVYLHEEK